MDSDDAMILIMTNGGDDYHGDTGMSTEQNCDNLSAFDILISAETLDGMLIYFPTVTKMIISRRRTQELLSCLHLLIFQCELNLQDDNMASGKC